MRRCLEAAEPVLLVGETGTGKTTACQLAAAVRGQALHMLNCNQHTEAADFLGGFRPARCALPALPEVYLISPRSLARCCITADRIKGF